MEDNCGNAAYITIKREGNKIAVWCSDGETCMTIQEAKELIEELNKVILSK